MAIAPAAVVGGLVLVGMAWLMLTTCDETKPRLADVPGVMCPATRTTTRRHVDPRVLLCARPWSLCCALPVQLATLGVGIVALRSDFLVLDATLVLKDPTWDRNQPSLLADFQYNLSATRGCLSLGTASLVAQGYPWKECYDAARPQARLVLVNDANRTVPAGPDFSSTAMAAVARDLGPALGLALAEAVAGAAVMTVPSLAVTLVHVGLGEGPCHAAMRVWAPAVAAMAVAGQVMALHGAVQADAAFGRIIGLPEVSAFARPAGAARSFVPEAAASGTRPISGPLLVRSVNRAVLSSPYADGGSSLLPLAAAAACATAVQQAVLIVGTRLGASARSSQGGSRCCASRAKPRGAPQAERTGPIPLGGRKPGGGGSKERLLPASRRPARPAPPAHTAAASGPQLPPEASGSFGAAPFAGGPGAPAWTGSGLATRVGMPGDQPAGSGAALAARRDFVL